ncbi:MAG: hypothetical protein LUP97_06750 [Methanoregula sp.]|nr:hypothetical protein [Methanoregula sp.]
MNLFDAIAARVKTASLVKACRDTRTRKGPYPFLEICRDAAEPSGYNSVVIKGFGISPPTARHRVSGAIPTGFELDTIHMRGGKRSLLREKYRKDQAGICLFFRDFGIREI